MKIAAAVILYNPDEDFIRNIKTFAYNVDKLFVFDNTENNPLKNQTEINKISNSVYKSFDINSGIALRLNQACEMAISEGFTHLLTMDQDSYFDNRSFEKYIERIKAYEVINMGKVGIYCINYQPSITPVSNHPVSVPSTITSGSLINLKVYKETQGYNEDLFLDFVDAEFCYQVTNLGYEIIQFPDIVLTHKIGITTSGRSLKTFKVGVRQIHAPIRIYYLVRNSLFLLRKGNLNRTQKKEIKKSLWLLKNNILYHPQKKSVYYFLIMGVIDYLKQKMGKFQK